MSKFVTKARKIIVNSTPQVFQPVELIDTVISCLRFYLKNRTHAGAQCCSVTSYPIELQIILFSKVCWVFLSFPYLELNARQISCNFSWVCWWRRWSITSFVHFIGDLKKELLPPHIFLDTVHISSFKRHVPTACLVHLWFAFFRPNLCNFDIYYGRILKNVFSSTSCF